MYVCMGYMALITGLILCARSQDLLLSVSVRRVLVVISSLLDLRAEKGRVLRHVKLPRNEEASRKPRALSWDRTQAIGALAHGFTKLSYPIAFAPDQIERFPGAKLLDNILPSTRLNQLLPLSSSRYFLTTSPKIDAFPDRILRTNRLF